MVDSNKFHFLFSLRFNLHLKAHLNIVEYVTYFIFLDVSENYSSCGKICKHQGFESGVQQLPLMPLDVHLPLP